MAAPSTRPAVGSHEERAEAARQLQVALMQAGRSLKARLEAQGEELADYFLLHLIDQAGTLRSTELAVAASLDHSTVSRHTSRLVEAGRVWREPDPADRRAGLLSLTAAGRAALDQAAERRSAVLGAATAAWPDRDVFRLVTLLSRLGDDLAPSRRDPTRPGDAQPVHQAQPVHDKETA